VNKKNSFPTTAFNDPVINVTGTT